MGSEDAEPKHGQLTVQTREDHMDHTTLIHGLSGPVIYMVLPKVGGWKPWGYQKLNHQTYLKDIDQILEEEGRPPRRISVVDVNEGDWETVWIQAESTGIPFQEIPLSYDCLDCTKGVGDRNGASVIRQMEAHLRKYPDHRLLLSSERSMDHIKQLRRDIREHHLLEGEL